MKLRYFAWVRERIGKPEEEIEPPVGIATVADLMTWLSRRGEEYAHAFENPKVIRAAIGPVRVAREATLPPGDVDLMIRPERLRLRTRGESDGADIAAAAAQLCRLARGVERLALQADGGGHRRLRPG